MTAQNLPAAVIQNNDKNAKMTIFTCIKNTLAE